MKGASGVPCGQCMACRLSKASEWAVRCIHENGYWKKSVFATLTYNENELAKLPDQSLDKAEFTKFWKRLRKAIEPAKLRYYGCGEYGEKYGRPHYHAIIFGLGCQDQILIEEAWGKGFVHVGSVTPESARYTSDYIGKAVGIKKGLDALDILTGVAFGDRCPPFAIMSKGLGRDYLINEKRILRNEITMNGKRVPVPRYYRQKIWDRIGSGIWKRIQDDLEVFEGRWEYDHQYFIDNDDTRLIYKNPIQVEKNLIAKAGVNAKGFL